MEETTSVILNIAFAAFAIYGIVVLHSWYKAAKEVKKFFDDINKEIEDDDMV